MAPKPDPTAAARAPEPAPAQASADVTIEVLAGADAEVWHGGRQLKPGERASMSPEQAARHTDAGAAKVI